MQFALVSRFAQTDCVKHAEWYAVPACGTRHLALTRTARVRAGCGATNKQRRRHSYST
jgi:hypothetical protein